MCNCSSFRENCVTHARTHAHTHMVQIIISLRRAGREIIIPMNNPQFLVRILLRNIWRSTNKVRTTRIKKKLAPARITKKKKPPKNPSPKEGDIQRLILFVDNLSLKIQIYKIIQLLSNFQMTTIKKVTITGDSLVKYDGNWESRTDTLIR